MRRERPGCDRAPTGNAVRTATEARRRAEIRPAAHPAAIAGSAIAPYVRRILDRARLNFLSCIRQQLAAFIKPFA